MNTDQSAMLRLVSWHHGRFELRQGGGGVLHARDWLMPYGRELSADRFQGLTGLAFERARFIAGFVPGALGAAIDDVADRPRHPEDSLFWQYPCRTEGAAWDLHAPEAEARRIGDDVHMYLGLPWATWIDKSRKQAWGATGETLAQAQWRRTALRLRGLREVLKGLGLRLRVHTVCQHIYWTDLLPRWQEIGVTDLWLSHCPMSPPTPLMPSAVNLHPWRLYAVNVEDPSRREGLQIGRDPAERPLLASFVGAHADHYLSDIRLRLRAIATSPDVVVQVTNQWHFEQVVYGQQIQGLATAPEGVDPSVLRYNRLLNDSVFSLCPAGAGANTLRLWESLASGAIPVLLGPWPRLPEGGSLGEVDWDAVLLRATDDELTDLPNRLRSISLEQRRTMQRLGMALFGRVQRQRCF